MKTGVKDVNGRNIKLGDKIIVPYLYENHYDSTEMFGTEPENSFRGDEVFLERKKGEVILKKGCFYASIKLSSNHNIDVPLIAYIDGWIYKRIKNLATTGQLNEFDLSFEQSVEEWFLLQDSDDISFNEYSLEELEIFTKTIEKEV